MAAILPYLAKQILDWTCGGGTPTRPAQRWCALYGSDNVEIGVPNYQRQSATFNAAASPQGSAATFVSLQMTYDLIVNGAGIWDASSDGNLLFSGALATVRTAKPNDSLVISLFAIMLT